ncbi:MAG: relaxase/mobilization nuclease domain-containing protein [Alphaproteobacteria bacterium]|nr:relaxase/mobilization nuclease domain-containing protein [Alphaproteobacteria bacterium]
MRYVLAEGEAVPQAIADILQENKQDLIEQIAQSQNWQQLHEAFGRYGLELRKRGNGLAIYDDQDQHVPVSQCNRAASKKHLE